MVYESILKVYEIPTERYQKVRDHQRSPSPASIRRSAGSGDLGDPKTSGTARLVLVILFRAAAQRGRRPIGTERWSHAATYNITAPFRGNGSRPASRTFLQEMLRPGGRQDFLLHSPQNGPQRRPAYTAIQRNHSQQTLPAIADAWRGDLPRLQGDTSKNIRR